MGIYLIIPIVYILAILNLITVHGPTGEEVNINIKEISSIRRPTAFGSQEHLAKETKCVLAMSNGKIIGTMETCEEVIKKIAAINK